MNRALLRYCLAASFSLLTACQCGSSVTVGGGGGGSHSGGGSETGGGGGANGGGTATGGGSATGGGGGGSGQCITNSDCPGAVCAGGTCCAAAQACGNVCCSSSTVCLFDACVTPGSDCHTANDCGAGQYCETALGGGSDGGVGTLDGGVCIAALPLGGKCLALPPVCADGGTGGPDAGCVAACEYHPGVGTLNAVPRWTWGPTATKFPNFTDVWSTPAVGRVHDSNCDGKVDELDAPVIVFTAGNDFAGAPAGDNCQTATTGTISMCHAGVLRMLDGKSGAEIWSLDKAEASSVGFAGISVALGDIDNDGRMDIAAVTGEGYVVMIDSDGNVKRKSDQPLPGVAATTFGWGGGLSLADMDGDGHTEIVFGASVFHTTGNAITLAFNGAQGVGGGSSMQALSTLVDLDEAADNHLELLAGNTAYLANGTVLWNNAAVTDGFPGVGDFDKDGHPDVVVVGAGKVWVLNALTGAVKLGPTALPGTGSGGPPTVADFDGDGKPEIGVAMATFYSVMKPNFTTNTLDVLWQTPNHDLSSSVTGSTVFDFEGDGKAEVIYADECFLWVFDGTNGAVRFAAPHTSFTATEASLVADVDGDGRAEIVMVTNGADPSNNGWHCLDANSNPTVVNGVTWTPSTLPNKSYRGIVVYGDSARSWVGTRTLWNEHTYHVSNVCDDRDSACGPPNVYGSIPTVETKSWTLPWLNNFRQNVQDHGLFDAPDAVLSLSVACSSPLTAFVSVRNIGLASLPAGVQVAVYKTTGGAHTQVATGATSQQLFPGQTETVSIALPSTAMAADTFVAEIVIDPNSPTFHECRADNDASDPVTPVCIQ
ncbi:MAG: VCBS repeat-containing protein [Myxococcaceae bacterium]